jgi:excisionase family DNA binding protein
MLSLLTESEIAARLHVSLAAVRRWRLERRGPPFVKVGVLVRYRPEDLESWVTSLPTGSAPQSREHRSDNVPIGL